MSAALEGGQASFFDGLSHYTLKNGLTVILHENRDLPVVAVAVGYNAGSIHEAPGKSGIAYLLEKLMMFYGSANVARLRHFSDISRVGGILNTEALEDQTLYFQAVPSNHLGLVLWLESDRMRSLDLTEDHFEIARAELLEELQRRKTTEPYFLSLQAFDQLLYSDYAFSHSLVGSEEDVRQLSLADIKAYYNARYVPQNAVLCISGRFDRTAARDLVSRYFESLPGGKAPTAAFEPRVFAKVPLTRTVEDPVASAPAVFLGFRLPAPGSPDFSILTLLDYVLMRGRSSRLNRRLLNRDAKIAFQMSGGIDLRHDRSMYKILITASPPQVQACRDAVFSEIEKVKRSFLSEAELAKAKALYRQDYLNRTSTALDRAVFLVQSFWRLQTSKRTMDDLPGEYESVLAVSAQDIIGIVNRYFVLDNSVVFNVRMR
ncbi:MAG: insulinase family protein [Candidatus Aminicenantes bacterium]|nr:insulinase family protein [Candidatus Aminicenantes bacterium]